MSEKKKKREDLPSISMKELAAKPYVAIVNNGLDMKSPNNTGWDSLPIGGSFAFLDKTKKFINNGKYNNIPNVVEDLLNKSVEHNSILQGIVDYIVGDGLQGEGSLEEFIRNNDGENENEENLNELLPLWSWDLKVHGGCLVKVERAMDGKTIARLDHIPYRDMRVQKDSGSMRFMISKNWDGPNKLPKNVKTYSEFSSESEEVESILYIRLAQSRRQLYTKPDYYPCHPWITLDDKVATFYNASIDNGYAPSLAIIFSHQPNEEQMEQIREQLDGTHKGAENASQVFLMGGGVAEIKRIEPISTDDLFVHQNNTISRKIRAAHKVTNGALFGLEDLGDTTFKFESRDQLLIAFAVFDRTIIRPFQKVLEDGLNKLVEANGIKEKLEIKSFKLFDEELQAALTAERPAELEEQEEVIEDPLQVRKD
jgi:hypothetical protein